MTARRVVALAVAFGAAVLPAAPAFADAARPGDVWSAVAGVVPADAPIRADIVGGDAFVRLTVQAGHRATVFDYATPPQPYLQFLADGTVQENVHSKAHFQNQSRYSDEQKAEVVGAPTWVTVATGGSYAWHDHRIHFMARSRPDVTQWQLDITVDDRPVAVAGFWGPTSSPSPWPWLVLGAGIGLWALVATWLQVRVGAALAVGAALFALPVAVSLGRLPAAGGLVRTGGLALAAIAFGGGALAARRPTVASALLAGSGIALALWAVRRFGVLGHAVLVTSMPSWWDRASVGVGLGVGLAVAGYAIRGLVAPDLGLPPSDVAPAVAPAAVPSAVAQPATGENP